MKISSIEKIWFFWLDAPLPPKNKSDTRFSLHWVDPDDLIFALEEIVKGIGVGLGQKWGF